MSRRSLVLVLLAFVVTRVAGAWFADHPAQYVPSGMGGVTGDIFIYQQWASFLTEADVSAYTGVYIEYPPGSLPFLALPEVIRGDLTYQTAFILMSVVIDAVGLAGLIALARRWGSSLGPWLWVVAVPMLGPIVYARLDLVPAVTTIWAVTCAAAGSWFASGAWLGFGALVKLYPGLLLPAAVLRAGVAGDRAATSHAQRTLVAGAALLVVAPLLPFVTSLSAVGRSVLGYHAERGLQVESVWASALFVAAKFGYPFQIVYNFGAFHVDSPAAPPLLVASTVLSLVALVGGTWLAWRTVPRGDVVRLAAAMFTILITVQAVGKVFSPQFVVWLIALGAAAVCHPRSPIKWPVLLLAPIAVLTQVVFPFLYAYLAPLYVSAISALVARNVLLVVCAAWCAIAMLRSAPRREVTEEPAAPEPVAVGA